MRAAVLRIWAPAAYQMITSPPTLASPLGPSTYPDIRAACAVGSLDGSRRPSLRATVVPPPIDATSTGPPW